jgi:hypothetical protein
LEVRPDWYVPAVPDVTLGRIYGNRIPDPRVEFAVLSFEYWSQHGKVSRSLLHREMLPVVRKYIAPDNMDEFVRLLVERGDIDDFVELLQFPVDDGGVFRRFMIEKSRRLASRLRRGFRTRSSCATRSTAIARRGGWHRGS